MPERLQPAFNKAVTALAQTSSQDIKTLTVVEGAFLLRTLPNHPKLTLLRQQLAKQLRDILTEPFIKQADLAAVFAAFGALWFYDSSLVSGHQLGLAIHRLTDSEVAVGGPYQTGGKLDLLANAYIALFVQNIAKPLPKVQVFLAKSIAEQAFTEDKADLAYLLAEATDDATLRSVIRNAWQTWPLSRQVFGLAVLGKNATMLQIRRTLEAHCKQQVNGFWQTPLPAITDSHLGAKLCMTALTCKAIMQQQQVVQQTELEQKHQLVIRAAHALFADCSEPLRSSVESWIKIIDRGDARFEITLLGRLFAQSLLRPPRLAERFYTTLGLASLCGWIAYTIFDDILDGEGRPADLPVATIALRSAVACFRKALPSQKFEQYTITFFRAMDEANLWESQQCRSKIENGYIIINHLPNYKTAMVLADRSVGHILAPLAVHMQNSVSDKAVAAVESAFRQYLIARQLTDDMQDWKQDISAGHMSYVVTAILQDLQVKPGRYDLATLLPKMQTCFRQKTVITLCGRIQRHLNVSRHAFEKSQLLSKEAAIYEVLQRLEQTVCYSLDVHCKMQLFAGYCQQNQR